MDPEALVQCPYDKAHQIRVSRLPYHLVKCQRNNPQVARTLEVCPFNARHRLPRAELQRHIACCPDQRQLFDCHGTRPPGPQPPLRPPLTHIHTHTSLLCSLCPQCYLCAPVTQQSSPRSPWPGRPHRAKRTGRQVSVHRVPPHPTVTPIKAGTALSPFAEVDELEEAAPFILNTTAGDLPLQGDR
uniref:Gametocyte specific factor 1 n=1 Tax=Coturnix japonica TaxID=93934 RepID=A0A8C2YGZ1_COTJA